MNDQNRKAKYAIAISIPSVLLIVLFCPPNLITNIKKNDDTSNTQFQSLNYYQIQLD